MKVNLVYMTTGSKEEAKTIGKELVKSKLAACVNIIDSMNSIYWWEGELQDDTEVILIAKTTETLVPELIEKVKTLHSYECPCVLSLPVSDGNGSFLKWIADEVKKPF
jgi:periplasmic divalent cation tolerance protein